MASWVWEYFTKDDVYKKTVSCKACCVTLGTPKLIVFNAFEICQGNGLEGKVVYHGNTGVMLNHLKHRHAVEQHTPKGVQMETWCIFTLFEMPQVRKRSTPLPQWPTKPRRSYLLLSSLQPSLVDDPMFRKQFGVSIPIGFDPQKLSTEMQALAVKIDERILEKPNPYF